MDQEKVIRSLKLQLRIERTAIALFFLLLMARWGYGYLQDRPCAILADGKPVAYVAGSEIAAQAIEDVKKTVAGIRPADVTFAEEVRISKASGSVKVMTKSEAAKALSEKLSLRVTKYAILVDGTPVVAVDSEDDAVAVLEAAKQKFGSLAKNLMEEPQFKEQIKVQQMSVDPALYRAAEQEALDAILSGGGGHGVYVVAEGDLAVNVAKRLGISIEELKSLNPGRNLHKLQIGDQIRISTRKGPAKPRITVVVRNLETRTEKIPYRTETISSIQMYAGKQFEISRGRNGLRKVVIAETYENGVRSGWEVVEETVIQEPAPRRVAMGIRPR